LIGAPFGLNGQVKVRPFSGEVDHLLALQTVTVRLHGKEQTLRVEECTELPPVLLMKFAGINSPEAAKTLGGAELLADREHAGPLKPGEFYVEDLKGLAVIAAPENDDRSEAAGAVPIGHITDIVEGGGGELAEIRLVDGGVRLVPFRKEFFTEISPEKRTVLLRNRWILA
jgi:16S rRNA processing protein RimM